MFFPSHPGTIERLHIPLFRQLKLLFYIKPLSPITFKLPPFGETLNLFKASYTTPLAHFHARDFFDLQNASFLQEPQSPSHPFLTATMCCEARFFQSDWMPESPGPPPPGVLVLFLFTSFKEPPFSSKKPNAVPYQ